jgi:hypothetical protein
VATALHLFIVVYKGLIAGVVAGLVITVQAKLAVLARTIAPELFCDAMSLVQPLRPRPVGPEGDVAATGRAAGSDWSSSTVLAPHVRRRATEQ